MDCEGNIRLELDVVGGALGPIDNDVSQFISNPEVDAGFNETLNKELHSVRSTGDPLFKRLIQHL